MHSRLAVIMVADIVGYSGLMARDELAGVEAVKEVNDTQLVPLSNQYSGEILKRMGDGWIIAFGSISTALKCAVEIQQALAHHPVVKLRIGAHLGEIIEDDDDFYGAGVNLAARLQAEAPPGGLMVSQDLFRQLTGDLAAQFESAGPLQLKNIPDPIEGYRWEPKTAPKVGADTRPVVVVEKIDFAPADADTESAALDLRDQLLMALSKRTGIRVVDALSSSADNPTYVLRGRLRMAGGKARLNMALIVCETGEPAFSQNYQGDTSDIFAFFDDTVTLVSGDIRNRINLYDADRLRHVPVDQLGVSDLLARAAGITVSGTYDDWTEARGYVSRALELDPDQPMALGMLSMGNVFMFLARFEEPDPALAARIERDVNRAVSLMPGSDFLFTVRSYYHLFFRKDADAAMRDARHAVSLDPTYYLSIFQQAQIKMYLGEFDEALAMLERISTMTTDASYEPMRLVRLAFCQYCRGDYSAAAEAMTRVIHLHPGAWNMHRFKAIILRELGDDDGALASDRTADALPKIPSVVMIKPPLPLQYEDLLTQLAPTEGL